MNRLYRFGLYVLIFIFMNIIFINNLAWTIIEDQTKISNYYRSNNVVKFIMRQDLEKDDILKLYQSMDHTLLYGDVCKIDGGKVISVIFKDGIFIPNLIEGKLFTEDDFAQGTSVAIIGKNIVDSQYYNDKFIELFERKFQIIGITTYKNNTALDNVIFLNLTSLNALPKYTYFYLDGQSIAKIDSAIEKIGSYFDIYVIDEKHNPLDRIILLSDKYKNINKIVILIISLSMVLYCSFAFMALKRETYIGILLGFSIWNILKLILERYFFNNFIIILVILLEWFFLYLLGTRLSLLTLVVQLFLYLVIINMVLFVYSLGKFYKK